MLCVDADSLTEKDIFFFYIFLTILYNILFSVL